MYECCGSPTGCTGVPAGTHLRILPDKATSYEATAKLIEQFQKSEYKLKMGYVNVAEDPKD